MRNFRRRVAPVFVAIVASVLPGVVAASPLPVCAGDCDLDGEVTVSELIRGVNIALGYSGIGDCTVFDRNDDRQVTIGELILAVNAVLGDCGAQNRCGGIDDPPCLQGEFCEFPPATCELGTRSGACIARPGPCPEFFSPVCGCDGVTYGNDCERQAAGASKAYDGECGSLQQCNGIAGIPCPEGEFCELPHGSCNAADLFGICEPEPGACPRIFDPVCGCDGVTYGNDCERKRARVVKDHDGPCVRSCGSRGLPPCEDNEICEFPTGTCGAADQPGICEPRPLACPQIFDPVCGCDGMTYGNDCDRQAAGMTKAHDGMCSG